MATTLRPLFGRTFTQSNTVSRRCLLQAQTQWRRAFQTSVTTSKIPDFGFAFDIDGVLVRSNNPVPGAHEALSYLQKEHIPFILLTNGGGKSEEVRTADLSKKLDVKLDPHMIIQSHTPFADLKEYHDKTVLVVGGDYDGSQQVAQKYGFKNAVTPADIYCAYPEIWPFSRMFTDVYQSFAKPLPKTINPASPHDSLKIDAIFVYNDSRDWGLDTTIMIDTLMSEQGILGTLSSKNGDKTLLNNGWLQDGQPTLYYSNPDLWWAASYHLNRFGQGAFQKAFEGVWNEVTGGAALKKVSIGKPTQPTFEFCENRLRQNRKQIWGQVGLNDPLRKVYMIGDNPESDIRGANNYESPHGSQWTSILVRTGVYKGPGEPSCQPDIILDDVQKAVEWAIEKGRK